MAKLGSRYSRRKIGNRALGAYGDAPDPGAPLSGHEQAGVKGHEELLAEVAMHQRNLAYAKERARQEKEMKARRAEGAARARGESWAVQKRNREYERQRETAEVMSPAERRRYLKNRGIEGY